MLKFIRWGLIFLLIFSPVFKGGKEIASLTFIQLFIIVLTIGYLVNLKTSGVREASKNWIFCFKTNILDSLLVCFLVILIISTFTSIYLYPSVIELFKIISYILLYRLVFKLVNTNDDRNKILNVIILIGTIIAITGIYQYFRGKPMLVNFPNVNLAAGYLVVGIALALSKLITGTKYLSELFSDESNINKGKCLISDAWCLTAIVVMLVCLMYTRSRGAFLSLLAVFTFLSVIKFKRRGLIFLICSLILIFIILPQDYIIKLLKLGGADPYALKRVSIWGSGLKAIIARPILGWGLGTFGYIFYRYNFPVTGAIAQYEKVTRFTHNEFIQIGAEAGIVALIILILMIIVVFRKGIKNYRINLISDASRQRYHIIAPLAGLVGILTHSLVDFNLHLPTIAILFIFFVGMTMNIRTIQSADSEKTYFRFISFKTVFIILLLILSILVSMPYIAHLYSQQENYRKAIFFNPIYSPYHTALGKTYEQKFRDSQEKKWEILTINEYKKSIRLNPEYPYNYQDLAAFYYNYTENLDEAIKNYEMAIKRAPYDASLYFNLASIYFNEKMFYKAVNIYNKTVELEPNYLRAYYQLGRAYEEIGDLTKALSSYQRIIIILGQEGISNPSSDYEKKLMSLDTALVYNRVGLIYTRQDMTEWAIANYKKALEINPKYAEVHSNLGGTYYRIGLYKLATDECQKALSIEPENEMFKKNLEQCLKQLKR